jgi:DNA-binding LacI/PurR family transcriptional regulator
MSEPTQPQGVSIRQVADAAGVSTASVSRALSGRGAVSDATRAKVEAAAAELGYVISSSASSLASGRTRSVGIICPTLDRWYFATLVGGIADELARSGYDTTLYSVTDDPAERRDLFNTVVRRRRVDALLVVALDLKEGEQEALGGAGLPGFGVGGPLPGLPAFTADEDGMARQATEHLLGLGHTRIAHLGGSAEFDVDFHVPARRRAGWEDALLAADLTPDASLTATADFTVAGGRDAARSLLGSGHTPTAIFAASDEMAVGAVIAATQLGFRIPEDLSVVGIDGHPLGEVFGLTTVDQHVPDLAVQAARRVVAHLDGGVALESDQTTYDLVVRTSTSRP